MGFPFKHIAYFITYHGYGHAARCMCCNGDNLKRSPSILIDIYSSVPDHFFKESLSGRITFHPVNVDIGLIQESPFTEDLVKTLADLDNSHPYDLDLSNRLAQEILELGCDLVICDISPLGIIIAGKAKLPSVLIENFTWDWIYEFYVDEYPGFQKHIHNLRHIYLQVRHSE